MSEIQRVAIGPVRAVGRSAPVQPVQGEPISGGGAGLPAAQPAAITGGSLPAAYAQLVLNADKEEAVIRVRDAATDAVIHEYSSDEVSAMSAQLRQYTPATVRRRAAQARKSRDRSRN